MSPSSRFTASDADLLATSFDDVHLEVLDGVVEVPEAAPVVAYVDSLRAHLEQTAGRRDLGRFVDSARELAERAVERDGLFRLSTGFALFTCR